MPKKVTAPKAKGRHKITFMLDTDLEVAVLGALGQTTKAIARQTKLSECQVQYRLTKAQIKRCDYRNGTSSVAKMVHDEMDNMLMSEYRRVLPPQFTA